MAEKVTVEIVEDAIEDVKEKESATEARFLLRSNEEMDEIKKGFIPENTTKNTQWALSVFKSWLEFRNGESPEEEQCPPNLLEDPEEAALNYWLSRFVSEIQRKDGKPYPPRTRHQILCGLQRHMLDLNPYAPKFMDQKNLAFRDLHNSCDHTYRKLRKDGVGSNVRHASIFSAEEEEQLCTSGVLGTHSPVSLQNTVFFYVGKRFCIRGGEEQRNLRPSQFVKSDSGYTYVEQGSKNNAGGLKMLHKENKIVPCPAVADHPRCLVRILEKYFQKLPLFAFEKDIFYCRPKKDTPGGDLPWYDCIPVGKNTLASMVAKMCKEAGIPERSNHSLRATGATALFQAEIPERIIQKTTGHHSLKALRSYERISHEQHLEVSKVLMSHGNDETFLPRNKRRKEESDSFQGFIDCTIKNVTINNNYKN